jgi:CHASE2 domain-containing sensor protein
VTEHRIILGLRVRRERHTQRHLALRAAVILGAFALLLIGALLLVLPGPGIPLIGAALAALALEFVWAERLLAYTLRKAERAKRAIRR